MLALPLVLVLLFSCQICRAHVTSSDESSRYLMQLKQQTNSSLTKAPEGVTLEAAAAAVPVEQRTAGQASTLPAGLATEAKRSYQSMMQTPLYGPDWLLSKGLKNELSGRNWRRLAAKLATPGSNTTVVAFGGSVSTGFALPQRNANWISQFCAWLQSAFPHTNIIQVRSCCQIFAAATAANSYGWNLVRIVWCCSSNGHFSCRCMLAAHTATRLTCCLALLAQPATANDPIIHFRSSAWCALYTYMQVNLARDATNIPMAETCWYHKTPADADLVMIEYNLNSCSYFNCFSIVAPQVGGNALSWCMQRTAWCELKQPQSVKAAAVTATSGLQTPL
jgi:hypothetical protein